MWHLWRELNMRIQSFQHLACNILVIPRCNGHVEGLMSLCTNTLERISWHEKLREEDALQRMSSWACSYRIIWRWCDIVTFYPLDSPYFYIDALYDTSHFIYCLFYILHELTVMIFVSNLVDMDKSLSENTLTTCYWSLSRIMFATSIHDVLIVLRDA